MDTTQYIKEIEIIFENKDIDFSKDIIIFDYNEIISHSLEVGEYIHTDFEECKKLFEIVLEQKYSDTLEDRKIEIRFFNLPPTLNKNIGHIRKEEIGKFYQFEGLILRVSDPKIALKSITVECANCLPKGTKVLTPTGYKPIEKSNQVISIDENFKPIICEARIIKTGKKQIYKINNEIECSPEHKWFVYRDGMMQVIQTKDLNKKDILIKIYDGKNKKMSNMWEKFQCKDLFYQSIWNAEKENKIFYYKNMFNRVQEQINRIKKYWFKETNRFKKNKGKISKRKIYIKSFSRIKYYSRNNKIKIKENEYKNFNYTRTKYEEIFRKRFKNMYSLSKKITYLYKNKKRNIKKKYTNNMFSTLFKQISDFISIRNRKKQDRQQKNDKSVQKRIFNSTNRKHYEYKFKFNYKKIKEIWCEIKRFKRTMQIKCKNRQYLQAWKKMWRTRISEIGKRKFRMEVSKMRSIKGQKQKIVSSPHRWESLQQFSRQLNGSLSIMPYEVTSVTETEKKVEMYDLQVPIYNNFILDNGVITHNCGNVIKVLQVTDELKLPQKCGCGRQKPNRIISKEWKDVQHIMVEEYITDYTTKKSRPTVMKLNLDEGLVHKDLTKIIQPGRHIKFTGIVKDVPIKKGNVMTVFSNFEIDVNHLIIEEVSLFNLKVPPKYITEFKRMDKKDILNNLKESIFLGIEGQDIAKEILTISLARGIKSYNPDGTLDQRDTINVFICSNPGSSKSDMSKMIAKIDLISMVISGKGTSGAGLTGCAVFDKQSGSWNIESGAINRCNHGILVCDEIDKIEDKDTSALNEAMTNLSFTIAKANQIVTLESDTSIIALANPHGRKFDSNIEKYRQITLKPDLLDRFDIWLSIEKLTDTNSQKKVINKIIKRFNTKELRDKAIYDLKFIRYYYAWIRQTFKPVITQEIADYASSEISKLMNNAGKNNNSTEISYRLVGNVIRFALAIAKLMQSNFVDKEHIDMAINYQRYGFQSLDMLDKFGNVSIERLNFEIPAEQKRKSYTFIDLMKEKYELTKKPISFEKLEEMWEEEGNDKKEVDNIIEKLKMKGDILEARNNFYVPL